MRQTREILRQKLLLGRSHRAIAKSVGVSAGVVSLASTRATAASLNWEQIESLDDCALETCGDHCACLAFRGTFLEDACQDALVIIHRQLPSFEGRSTLKTWIYGIAEHVAANSRRTQRRKTAPLEPLSELSEPAVAAHGEAVEAAEVMQRFCMSLDDEGRALFVLALFEQTPAADVAKALGPDAIQGSVAGACTAS